MRPDQIETNKDLTEAESNQLSNFNDKKRELFEYANLEDRVYKINAFKETIDGIVDDFKAGESPDRRSSYMEVVAGPLMETPQIDGSYDYPALLRLYSFDKLINFFEQAPKDDKEKDENISTASNMLYATATSSDKEELHNSFLGLLNYYSDQARFDDLNKYLDEKRLLVNDGVSLSEAEEEELVEKKSLFNKMKNFRDTLGSIANNKVEDKGIRYLASLSFGDHDSDFLNRGKYFAKLYEGDRDKFFAELEELKEKKSTKSKNNNENNQIEIKYEDYSHECFLSEGFIPSINKEDEAKEAEKSIDVCFWGKAGRTKTGKLSDNSERFGFSASIYKDVIRSIGYEKGVKRRDIIDTMIMKYKNVIYNSLIEKELQEMEIEKPEDIEIHCMTLFNKDFVRAALRKVFGQKSGSFDKIKNGNELEQRIIKFFDGKNIKSDETKAKLEELVMDWKIDNEEIAA